MQDYSGEAVNAKNFLAILAGKKASGSYTTGMHVMLPHAFALAYHAGGVGSRTALF
jgi:hypothetical protein